jgi:hypothetical protein
MDEGTTSMLELENFEVSKDRVGLYAAEEMLVVGNLVGVTSVQVVLLVYRGTR